ncbi:hypothetical protein HYS91_00405 [Candidatus Daviesbacteria bacterium]|nr:hypothetical protein [Candidatus Daviesbacteria bacterium]
MKFFWAIFLSSFLFSGYLFLTPLKVNADFKGEGCTIKLTDPGTNREPTSLVIGKTYDLESSLIGSWQQGCSDCGNSHSISFREVSESYNGIYSDGAPRLPVPGTSKKAKGDYISHGQWDPSIIVNGQCRAGGKRASGKRNHEACIVFKSFSPGKAPLAPGGNGKNGPWRIKFTPTEEGTTAFNVRMSNNINNYSGGAKCLRTTRVFNIIGQNLSIRSNTSCNLGTPIVNLSWDANSGTDPQNRPDSDYYEVYRLSGNNYSLLGNTPNLNYQDRSNLNQNSSYNYYIRAVNPNVSTNYPAMSIRTPNCSSPTIVSVELTNKCYNRSTFPNPLRIYAQNASGINRVTYELIGDQNASGSASLREGTAESGYWHTPFNLSNLTFGEYQISAQASDNTGGLTSSAPIDFSFAQSCEQPFLETTGGNVHSNREINLP